MANDTRFVAWIRNWLNFSFNQIECVLGRLTPNVLINRTRPGFGPSRTCSSLTHANSISDSESFNVPYVMGFCGTTTRTPTPLDRLRSTPTSIHRQRSQPPRQSMPTAAALCAQLLAEHPALQVALLVAGLAFVVRRPCLSTPAQTKHTQLFNPSNR